MAKRSDAGRWVASRWLVLATAAAAWIGAAPSAFHAAAGTAASGQPLPIEGVDRFITVNGLKLHYLDWGNDGKPPFILLHGISSLSCSISTHGLQCFPITRMDA
jgi:hypothetical protein